MKALFAVLIAVLALAAGAVVALRSPSAPEASAPVKVTVAGVALTLDPRLARTAADLASPALEELDLVFAMPDFAPVGGKAGAYPLEKLVFLTLRRPDDRVEPRDKPARLYLRFLGAAVEAHPTGLILRRFEPGGPYDGEQLYMTPPEGRAFWARCASATAGLPATCVSEARIGGVDARLRFAPELIGDWEKLNAGVARLVEGMGR